VLDVGRMERGERAYDLRALDLRALAHEAVELFAPQAAAAGLEVAVAAPAAPLPVLGDRAALDQAVLNVLDNARKYAALGRRVSITLEGTLGGGDGTARLTVRDFGPGIPPAWQERVFERFVRGVPEGNGTPGVGLGLYLSRTILRAHGGDLTALVPEDGRGGVALCFTLPLVREEVAA
jgi:signal transduction histidine kinase